MSTRDSPTDAPSAREDVYELTARLSTAADGTTVCTIYPTQVELEGRPTTWISAKEGSFVEVEDFR